jgi:hypothetical protein
MESLVQKSTLPDLYAVFKRNIGVMVAKVANNSKLEKLSHYGKLL